MVDKKESRQSPSFYSLQHSFFFGVHLIVLPSCPCMCNCLVRKGEHLLLTQLRPILFLISVRFEMYDY